MRHRKEKQKGLDSQCLSYLLDAIDGISEPKDDLAEERKALLRIWFYTPGTFIVTETVLKEVGKIKNKSRRELHDSFINTLFLDYPAKDKAQINKRAEEFKKIHSGTNDCLILAEAEELRVDVLLTYDEDYWKHLSSYSDITALMKPTEYWNKLGINKGEKPVAIPHPTNPLSKESWWKW